MANINKNNHCDCVEEESDCYICSNKNNHLVEEKYESSKNVYNLNSIGDINSVENIDEIIEKFYKESKKYYDDIIKRVEENINNMNNFKNLIKKFKNLKIKRNTKSKKITYQKLQIQELFSNEEFKSKFTDYEIKIIKRSLISKIKGLYKHTQAWKTGICNLQIIKGITQENTISICITKNTLEANEQWLYRLFKELDKRYPSKKLNNKIMIISSKPNTLDGNATHCRSINDAIRSLTMPNDFKIIFVCSNKKRIDNIYDLALQLWHLRECKDLFRNLRILHDEAHNKQEGIPAFRNIVENIIALPNVLSYQPITASTGKIVDDDNFMWLKDNLENHAINFTEYDNTKSDDPNYSSISDYEKICFEDLKLNENWQNFNITEISLENFIKVDDRYKDKTIDELSDEDILDIDMRRKLEFCIFMKMDKEKEAFNNGLNSLNLNSILETNHFIEDQFNIHIISTPRRKIITHELCIIALEKSYNPIVLGIYGNQGDKYHLFMNGMDEICVDDIMGDGEFNCKFNRLINDIKSKDHNINRPFIIIGNYIPTGESLSFVNYEYGTVRSVIRLISTNAEEDYQTASRGNYMTTKFLENDSNWISPPKYLIGHTNFIENSLSYEKENDYRIDILSKIENDDYFRDITIPTPSYTNIIGNGNVAIPIKIEVDVDDKNYDKLIEIASKKRRSPADKRKWLKLLKESVNNKHSDFHIIDKTGKFNWDEYTINNFRCYSKECKLVKGNWKFKSYKTNFDTDEPFINWTNHHKPKECDILVCKDKYIFEDEYNGKNCWWMGYKY